MIKRCIYTFKRCRYRIFLIIIPAVVNLDIRSTIHNSFNYGSYVTHYAAWEDPLWTTDRCLLKHVFSLLYRKK